MRATCLLREHVWRFVIVSVFQIKYKQKRKLHRKMSSNYVFSDCWIQWPWKPYSVLQGLLLQTRLMEGNPDQTHSFENSSRMLPCNGASSGTHTPLVHSMQSQQCPKEKFVAKWNWKFIMLQKFFESYICFLWSTFFSMNVLKIICTYEFQNSIFPWTLEALLYFPERMLVNCIKSEFPSFAP